MKKYIVKTKDEKVIIFADFFEEDSNNLGFYIKCDDEYIGCQASAVFKYWEYFYLELQEKLV
jgi:hypothetical protein